MPSPSDAATLLDEMRLRQTQLESQLAETQQQLKRYTELCDLAPVAHLVLDRASTILETNRQGANLMGYTSLGPTEQAQPQHFDAFVDQDSLPVFQSFLERTFAGQASGTCEISLRTPQNVQRFVRIQATCDAARQSCNAMIIDITASKTAEIAAQKNHDLLTNLSTHVPGILYQFRLDPDGSTHFTYVSETIPKLYGVSLQQACEDSSTLFSRVHPDDADGLADSMLRSASTLEMWRHEYRMMLPDGTAIWRALDARPEKLANGSILWHGYTIDITDRRSSEEELRKSEERWKLALEGAGHGVWDSNLQSGKTLFSKRWKEILGYADHEIGDDRNEWVSRVHPEDMPLIEASQRRILEQQRNSETIEFRIQHKDGSWRWMLGSGILVARNDKGETLRMVGTLSDITERKQVEEALRISEERWKFALEGAGDGVWDWNVPLGEITFSRRAREIMGHTEEEVPRNYEEWCSRIHPDDMAHSLDNREKLMTQLKDASSNEVRFRCKDGTWKWLLSRGMVVSRNEIGEALRLVGTISDITRRKQTEEELRLTLMELEERRREAEMHSAAKSRFLNAASHDLRQPLYATQLFADGLADAALTPQQQEILQNLQLSIKAMSAQLQMLLDVSRLDMGNIVPKMRDLPIASICRDLATTYAPIAKNAGVQLRFLPGSGVVRTDAVLLCRLLGNLIDNAIKFARSGSVVVCARRSAQDIRIEVRDSGPGIAPEHHQQIFDEYYQIDNPARNPNVGLGLGLSIAQRIAHLLDAPLTLQTRVGQGTVFAITLPAISAARHVPKSA